MTLTRALPTPRVLLSTRSRKWNVVGALAELIDNGFGEQRGNARSVDIEWDPRKRVFSIMDDGVGMDTVIDLFTLGKGSESGGGDTGRYGVGGSEALLWLSDKSVVYTLKDGKVAQGFANWVRCIRQGEFPEIDESWHEATPANCPTELLEREHGTLIRLNLRDGIRFRIDSSQEHLSRLYGVGLRSGRRITWTTLRNGEPTSTQLREWSPGKLQAPVISTTITLDNGLSAYVRAGRADGISVANSKLSVNYVYRQVEETTSGFSKPVQGAVGHIDLAPEWLPYLTTTKDGFTDDTLRDELMALVSEALTPLIDALWEEKRSVLFNKVRISLSQKFEGAFAVKQPGEDEPDPPIVVDVPVPVPDPEVPVPVEVPEPDPEPDPEPEPPVEEPEHDEPQMAEIQIEESTLQGTRGRLCEVTVDGRYAVAFIALDHPIVKLALESEPINQRLLEMVVTTALAKELVQGGLLVSLGLMTKRQYEKLHDQFKGEASDIWLYVIRVLTDSVVSEEEEEAAA